MTAVDRIKFHFISVIILYSTEALRFPIRLCASRNQGRFTNIYGKHTISVIISYVVRCRDSCRPACVSFSFMDFCSLYS